MPAVTPVRRPISLVRTILVALAVFVTALAPVAIGSQASQAASPTPLIVDTDIATDADDAGALAIALALQGRGEANVLAVTVNTRLSRPLVADNSWKCVQAITQFYNASNVAFGTAAAGGADPAPSAGHGNFIAPCAEKATKPFVTPGDAVAVLKSSLTASPGKVTIVETGYSQNLSALLNSPGGKELVAAKVSKLVVMGGSYLNGNHENNIAGDAEAAKNVSDNWPTPIVWDGSEVGDWIDAGSGVSSTDAASPVRASYEAFAGAGNAIKSWDPSAVYYSVRGLGTHLFLSDLGKNNIATDGNNYGNNTFVADAGTQRFLKLSTNGDEAVIKSNADALASRIDSLLNAAPPAATTTTTSTTTSTTVPTTTSTTSSTTSTTVPTTTSTSTTSTTVPTSTTSTSTTSTSTTSTTVPSNTGSGTAPVSNGYRVVGADGSVQSFGVPSFGDLAGRPLNGSIIGATRTASERGYWLLGSDGGIFSFGDATFFGSMGGQPLNKPIVGMAPTASGRGYWLVASDGGVFAFGDALFYGSMGGQHLNKPIVGITSSTSGHGYRLVASDGGIFAFGDAAFYGSMGGQPLNKPIVGMTRSATGNGYRLVASDGGIFAFGDAAFYGSMGGKPLNKPIVGMQTTASGNGYWFVASDGGVFNFGDAAFVGSAANSNNTAPITALA